MSGLAHTHHNYVTWTFRGIEKRQILRSSSLHFLLHPWYGMGSHASSSALCYQHFFAGGESLLYRRVRNAAAKKLFTTPPTHNTQSVFHYLKAPSILHDALQHKHTHTLWHNGLTQFSAVSAPSAWNDTDTYSILKFRGMKVFYSAQRWLKGTKNQTEGRFYNIYFKLFTSFCPVQHRWQAPWCVRQICSAFKRFQYTPPIAESVLYLVFRWCTVLSSARLSPVSLLHMPRAMFRSTYRPIDWIIYVREGHCGSVLLFFTEPRASSSSH